MGLLVHKDQVRSPSTQAIQSTGQRVYHGDAFHFRSEMMELYLSVFLKESQGHSKWDGKELGNVQEEHSFDHSLLQGLKLYPGFPIFCQIFQEKETSYLKLISIFVYKFINTSGYDQYVKCTKTISV